MLTNRVNTVYYLNNVLFVTCLHRARRAAKEAKDAPAQPAPEKARVDIKKFVKIGRPGYKVTKQRDQDNGQQSLLFQVSKIMFPSLGMLGILIISSLKSYVKHSYTTWQG